ncbi:MAG TPA: hypothetical protein PLZ86_05185 [bacterium]|nr:hypothetical protein [bacterium]
MSDFKVTSKAIDAINKFMDAEVFPKELKGKTCKADGDEVNCTFRVNENDREILSLYPGGYVYRNECLKGKMCEAIDSGWNESKDGKIDVVRAAMGLWKPDAAFLKEHGPTINALRGEMGIPAHR